MVMKATFWSVGMRLNHPAVPLPGNVTLVAAGGGANRGMRACRAGGRAARGSAVAGADSTVGAAERTGADEVTGVGAA
ncbi:hypothetical protein Abr02nite_25550 [Paractinoplanes brasiliensis]|nr:hypothetical protein Abr02nite_25550 [Actinoplanes brasiliensis]